MAGEPRGRVLIVDDERAVGSAIGRLLNTAHDVTVTTSAQEALTMMLGGELFDIIFCDLMMPIMTGMELHAELLRRLPDQASKMVFLTGGAFTPLARAFLDEVPNARLEKPFEMKALLALLGERLSKAPNA
jgi:CheY-like chemotaxis protein